jgi:23S rRNA pseudouridine1911/1915/1917 synthase
LSIELTKAKEINLIISRAHSGQRLDVFLAQSDAKLSRSRIKRLVEEGDVLVNGILPKPSQQLREGDTINLKIKPAEEAIAVAQNIPLDIVYEDDAIIVVNKPAGIVVHPAPGNPDNTLVNALLFHCKNLSGIGGVIRPGIVHRLDKGTSGLIVAAKTDEAHRSLSSQFENHEVHKTYQALVWGDVKGNQGEIIMAVGRHPVNRKKMSTKSRRGKDALTLWKVRERYGAATLLDVEIKTGRTHQIRVHLSERGYPLIGDDVYGRTSRGRALREPALKEKIKALDRQALHAAKLSFLHPVSGERVVFTSQMPQDLADLCENLRVFSQPKDDNKIRQSWKNKLR